jgi:hypothetical protein
MNWKWGKINIILLVLTIVYRGAAIPVWAQDSGNPCRDDGDPCRCLWKNLNP